MNQYCQLAKEAIETYIQKGETLSVSKKLPATLLKEKAGVFVSIHKNNDLRGCIGTLFSTKETLAKEIISNAIKAATKDPRFSKITEKELKMLSYEVSILGTFEQIEKICDLDPTKYGVYTKSKSNEKSALLLPDLSGIETPIKQLSLCLNKAGIDGNKEEFILFRFETKKFK
jgi:AmmeMemoRadiSam system protein A